mmetsp:Transcript_13988/g.28896  ORF Transcript_13988/g.28896 Transcript_13988/m.28896 type:complete len:134 (+) Transcript_13988:1060-1461(+)
MRTSRECIDKEEISILWKRQNAPIPLPQRFCPNQIVGVSLQSTLLPNGLHHRSGSPTITAVLFLSSVIPEEIDCLLALISMLSLARREEVGLTGALPMPLLPPPETAILVTIADDFLKQTYIQVMDKRENRPA